MEKKGKTSKIALVFLITGLHFLLGPGILYLFREIGIPVYSVEAISDRPGSFLMQTLLLSAYSFLLMGIAAGKLKKEFPDAMGLRVHGRLQWTWLAVLAALFAIEFLIGIRKNQNFFYLLFSLLYYMAAIGITEEFVIHGLCVYLLRDLPWTVKYLLPNFLFAMLHVLAFNGFAPLGWTVVWDFLRSQMPILLASGCCLQLIKDRTGTLWVPILLHGFIDFFGRI